MQPTPTPILSQQQSCSVKIRKTFIICHNADDFVISGNQCETNQGTYLIQWKKSSSIA